jgi:TorA maturation chaperone TorD
MASSETLAPDIETLLREAAAWRLIALLFECPRDGWREQLAALAAEAQDPRLTTAAEAAQQEASEGLHHSLFGPGGPVSPREVTYHLGVQMGYLLSELNAYYDAFAYRPDTTEAADHLAVESGFMAYLAFKQAYALASGDAEHARVTAEAAARFRTDHLAAMADRVGRALEIGGPPYLALAGLVLRERTGPPVRPILPMATEALAAGYDDDEMSCGPQ